MLYKAAFFSSIINQERRMENDMIELRIGLVNGLLTSKEPWWRKIFWISFPETEFDSLVIFIFSILYFEIKHCEEE